MKEINQTEWREFPYMEYMVVVVIVAVMYSISVIKLAPLLRHAREQADKYSLRVIETSIEAYKLSSGSLPAPSSINNKLDFEEAFSSTLPHAAQPGFRFYYNREDGRVLCEDSPPEGEWVDISD